MKKVGLFVAFAAAALFIGLGASTATAEAAGVEVADQYQLQAALQNGNIDYIKMTNDIAVTDKNLREIVIEPKRASNQLVIDGNGFTFTEYFTKGYDASYGIKLKKASNVREIVLENMTIQGQNGYGTVRVTCNKDVKLTYRNINYFGPQLTHHDDGTARYENSNITIRKHAGGSYAGEVAEVKNVELAGDVNITKEGEDSTSGNEIFWIKGHGSINVEPGANVRVTNDSYKGTKKDCYGNTIRYGCSGFVHDDVSAFNIGNDAHFTYSGITEFQDCGVFKSVNVGDRASFIVNVEDGTDPLMKVSGPYFVGQEAKVNYTINGSAGKAKALWQKCGSSLYVSENAEFIIKAFGLPSGCGLLYSEGDITVKNGAQFDVISYNDQKKCTSVAFQMVGCKTLDIQNPKRFLAYNNNDQLGCQTMGMDLSCGTRIKVNGYNVEYWELGAARSGGPYVLANSDYKWFTGDRSVTYNINAKGLTCNKYFCEFSTDFNGIVAGNYAKGLDKYTFAPKKNSNIFLVNGDWGDGPGPGTRSALVVDNVKNAATVIKGKGEANATVTVQVNNGVGTVYAVDVPTQSNGIWSAPVPAGVVATGQEIVATQNLENAIPTVDSTVVTPN